MLFSQTAFIAFFGLAASTTPAPPDCSGDAYRQFDFWLGQWQVTTIDAQGVEQKAGENSVQADLKGCTVTEFWRGSRGINGRSLNVYDRNSRQWKQFWVDNSGGVLELEGSSPKAGEMLMQSKSSNGQIQRIHWQQLENGDVRQHWQSSTDNGSSWTTVFDGRYRRMDGHEAAKPTPNHATSGAK